MNEIDNLRIMQPIRPGVKVPEELEDKFLFLVNLNYVAELDDSRDDFGVKESTQASQLRALSDRIIAIAEKLESLGSELSSFPDAKDYEEKPEELYDEAVACANESIAEGYRDIENLINQLAEAAISDFAD